MATQIEICNMALGQVRGAGSIQTLNEPSNEARFCKLYYDPARKFILENHPWKFANKLTALALLNEVPHEWLYSYAYPSDALGIRRLVPEEVTVDSFRHYIYQLDYYGLVFDMLDDQPIPYEVGLNVDGSQAIWTNQENAYVSYTMNQSSAPLFPSAFVTGFMHYLASMIAVPIAGRKEGATIMKDQLELYTMTMQSAEANNMFERYKRQKRESEMVTIRN